MICLYLIQTSVCAEDCFWQIMILNDCGWIKNFFFGSDTHFNKPHLSGQAHLN